MDELRDIKGLETISWLPIAPAWWVVLGGVLLIAVLVFMLRQYRLNYQNSWQAKALKKLQELQNNLNDPQNIGEIFELLKEVALLKFGRKACADLTGIEWLGWLNINDKNQFDWLKNGQQLVEIQYAPLALRQRYLQQENAQQNLKEMLQAISALVNK